MLSVSLTRHSTSNAQAVSVTCPYSSMLAAVFISLHIILIFALLKYHVYPIMKYLNMENSNECNIK